ncbi:MAG: phosphocarrier protein HPr [Gammaproteobacteria bacterium RIFCSPHIGHO2_12_FULL_45_9]|nr:MAG: phosphocarrier protein HPr [Gammaproteobacteria bacterium RIFCSPHIGHO2_12_FULL_45_9]
MLQRTVQLTNKLGLHARASMHLMDLACRFGSDIWIHYENKRADAKNILDVMVLGATLGSTLILEADGEDAEAALEALLTLINDRFGESE